MQSASGWIYKETNRCGNVLHVQPEISFCKIQTFHAWIDGFARVFFLLNFWIGWILKTCRVSTYGTTYNWQPVYQGPRLSYYFSSVWKWGWVLGSMRFGPIVFVSRFPVYQILINRVLKWTPWRPCFHSNTVSVSTWLIVSPVMYLFRKNSPFESKPKLARNNSVRKKNGDGFDIEGSSSNISQNYNPASGVTFRENRNSDVQVVGKGYNDDSSSTDSRPLGTVNNKAARDRRRVTKGRRFCVVCCW